MPARSTRINTSLMPLFGTGTSSSHKPGPASRFVSAFIVVFMVKTNLTAPQGRLPTHHWDCQTAGADPCFPSCKTDSGRTEAVIFLVDIYRQPFLWAGTRRQSEAPERLPGHSFSNPSELMKCPTIQ